MILTDIQDLFSELKTKHTCKEIARHFEKERKWVMLVADGCNFVLSPEFIAGLKHFGYELRLVKCNEEEKPVKQLDGQMQITDFPEVMP